MNLRAASIACALLACCCASAADLYKAVRTPIKAPDCISDPSQSFFADNVTQREMPHDILPKGRYYLVVRYLGDDAVSQPADYDFGRFAADYADVELRGAPITGLTVPDNRATWQRARRSNATPDDSSAFQIHCDHAGSFINSWTFAYRPLPTEGPHAVYAYDFEAGSHPPVFDGIPTTDFALEANIEIPWFRTWIDPQSVNAIPPIGQVSIFAYFRDRATGKPFALLLDIFDNRYAEVLGYQTHVSHDTETPFVSIPLNRRAKYATPYPKSALFTGTTWNGLKLFGARISQRQFRTALDDINAFCATRRELAHCASAPQSNPAFSVDVRNYELTSFGVLHEIFGTDARNHLSMGVHVARLGAWNFRQR